MYLQTEGEINCYPNYKNTTRLYLLKKFASEIKFSPLETFLKSNLEKANWLLISIFILFMGDQIRALWQVPNNQYLNCKVSVIKKQNTI